MAQTKSKNTKTATKKQGIIGIHHIKKKKRGKKSTDKLKPKKRLETSTWTIKTYTYAFAIPKTTAQYQQPE